MLRKLKSWIGSRLEKWASPEGRTLGDRGERQAERLLKSKRYRILERGLRTPHGELDLIALDKRTIVFVEVKTRRTDDPSEPFEAVDRAKQQKLTRLALTYLKRNQLLEHAWRFDIVGINWPAEGKPDVRHYVNAFEPTDRGQMFS